MTWKTETCLEMFKEICGNIAFILCPILVWNFNTKPVFLDVQFGREDVWWTGVFLAQLWALGIGRPAFLSVTNEFCCHVQSCHLSGLSFLTGKVMGPYWLFPWPLRPFSPYYSKIPWFLWLPFFSILFFWSELLWGVVYFALKIIYGRLSIVWRNR